MILVIKTDSMHAHLSLLDLSGGEVRVDAWEAGRELARDLLGRIEALVGDDWDTLSGVVVFRGPGSFTSLRIGITTANTIAYSQGIPIIGEIGDDWLEKALTKLTDGQNDTQVLPEYGSDPHITVQKK